MTTRLRPNFTPRPYQAKFMRYLENGGKRAVWVVHRRGGKDLTALHQTCRMAHRRKAGYWHIFPSAEQARKAIWEGFTKDGERIMEQVFPAAIRKSPRAFLPNAEMVVELKCGSIWRLMGSDRMEVVGSGPAGVVFSEFALAKPRTWDLVRPMLRENDGWAAFVTTPRGNNHAKKLFDVAGREPGWFRDIQTLYDTRAYDPDKTIAEERAEGMPEELIRQEYLCDWTAANVGSIYGDLVEKLEKRGGVAEFAHSTSEVFVSMDIGITDAAACWFWVLRNGLPEVIDYYENHGQPLSHYFDEFEAKGYEYRKFFLPHDARARTFVTGTTVLEQFSQRYGSGQVGIVPSLTVLDGIQASRRLLQQDIRIHARCAEGLEALRAYHWAWDEEKKEFSKKPVHDWSSHGADGFRYMAIVARAIEAMMRKPEEKEKPIVRDMREMSLDEMIEASESIQTGGRV